MPTLRSIDEIQRAHDVLVGIVLGEIPIALDEAATLRLNEAASVLCWILQHNHNVTFGETLARLEAAISQTGGVMMTQPLDDDDPE